MNVLQIHVKTIRDTAVLWARVARNRLIRALAGPPACAWCSRPCDGDPLSHQGPCTRDGLTFCSTLCSMEHGAARRAAITDGASA